MLSVLSIHLINQVIAPGGELILTASRLSLPCAEHGLKMMRIIMRNSVTSIRTAKQQSVDLTLGDLGVVSSA